MAKGSVGVLVSGGLDSAALLADLSTTHSRVWPIYIRQGLIWETCELYWLKRYLKAIPLALLHGGDTRRPGGGIQPLTILSLPMGDLYGAHWSTGSHPVPGARTKDAAVFLPGRNMVLSMKAAIFAVLNKIPILALGSLNHNPFPDAKPQFFEKWGVALGMGMGATIRIIAPYRRKTKAEVIRLGKFWPLHLSFSCIAPQGRFHCGRCNKCAERRRAFRTAGVPDKTIYDR